MNYLIINSITQQKNKQKKSVFSEPFLNTTPSFDKEFSPKISSPLLLNFRAMQIIQIQPQFLTSNNKDFQAYLPKSYYSYKQLLQSNLK